MMIWLIISAIVRVVALFFSIILWSCYIGIMSDQVEAKKEPSYYIGNGAICVAVFYLFQFILPT